MDIKTNAIRILSSKKINYQTYFIELDNAVSGIKLCELLNIDSKNVFKTLVTQGKSGKNYCFVIPVYKELDLKKCAKVTNEKYIEMILQKDLYPLTGYVHGGCSPIGMKKALPTFISNDIENFETIVFSGGKVGLQICLNTKDLTKIIKYSVDDITI